MLFKHYYIISVRRQALVWGTGLIPCSTAWAVYHLHLTKFQTCAWFISCLQSQASSFLLSFSHNIDSVHLEKKCISFLQGSKYFPVYIITKSINCIFMYSNQISVILVYILEWIWYFFHFPHYNHHRSWVSFFFIKKYKNVHYTVNNIYYYYISIK